MKKTKVTQKTKEIIRDFLQKLYMNHEVRVVFTIRELQQKIKTKFKLVVAEKQLTEIVDSCHYVDKQEDERSLNGEAVYKVDEYLGD